MLITLAWLPLQVSVTLCLILSATLIVSGAVSERRSWTLSAMTLIAVLMIWRGEAWKAIFLQSERQLSELQRQLQKPISSNIGFDYPGQIVACGAARHVLPKSSLPFLAGEFEEAYQYVASGAQTPQEDYERHKGNHKALVNLQLLDSEACLALMNAESDLERRELHRYSQLDISGDPVPNCENQSAPTPKFLRPFSCARRG